MNGSAVDDVPGLGLAVRPAEVVTGEAGIRMRMNGQPLPGVEQFHEQHRVGAVARDVVGAEPGHRVGGDRVAQQRPVGQCRRGR